MYMPAYWLVGYIIRVGPDWWKYGKWQGYKKKYKSIRVQTKLKPMNEKMVRSKYSITKEYNITTIIQLLYNSKTIIRSLDPVHWFYGSSSDWERTFQCLCVWIYLSTLRAHNHKTVYNT